MVEAQDEEVEQRKPKLTIEERKKLVDQMRAENQVTFASIRSTHQLDSSPAKKHTELPINAIRIDETIGSEANLMPMRAPDFDATFGGNR